MMDSVLEGGEIDLLDAAAAMAEMEGSALVDYTTAKEVAHYDNGEGSTSHADQVTISAQKLAENDLSMLMSQVGGEEEEEMDEDEMPIVESVRRKRVIGRRDRNMRKQQDVIISSVTRARRSAKSIVLDVKVEDADLDGEEVLVDDDKVTEESDSKVDDTSEEGEQVTNEQLAGMATNARSRSSHDLEPDIKQEGEGSSRRYVCNSCYKTCATRKELYVHALTHTDRQRFLCQVCDKGFTSESMYKRHQKMHAKEEKKRTMCHICQIVFQRRNDLEQHHLEVHVGQKVFRCTTCGLEFSWRENYQKHMRIHRKKPFMCALCKEDFEDIQSLGVHIASHEEKANKKREDDVKPNVCTVCGASFKFSFTLEAHMKGHVKDEKLVHVATTFPPAYTTVPAAPTPDLSQSVQIIHEAPPTPPDLKDEVQEEEEDDMSQDPSPPPSPPKPSPVNEPTTTIHESGVSYTDFDAKTHHCHICNEAFRWDFSLRAHLKIHETGDFRNRGRKSIGRVRTRGGAARQDPGEFENGSEDSGEVEFTPRKGRGPRMRGRGAGRARVRGRGRGRGVTYREPELFEEMPEPNRPARRGRKAQMMAEAQRQGLTEEPMSSDDDEEREDVEVKDEVMQEQSPGNQFEVVVIPQKLGQKRKFHVVTESLDDEVELPCQVVKVEDHVQPMDSGEQKSPARRGIFDILQTEYTPEKDEKEESIEGQQEHAGEKGDPIQKLEKEDIVRTLEFNQQEYSVEVVQAGDLGEMPYQEMDQQDSEMQSAERLLQMIESVNDSVPPAPEDSATNVQSKAPVETFSCDVCAKVFPAHDALKVHQLCHRVEKQIAYQSPLSSPERVKEQAATNWCATCQKTFSDQVEWARDKKLHAALRARRMFCEKQGRYFLHAIDAIVKKKRAFQCDVCHKRYKSYVQLILDQHRHRVFKPALCPKKKCKERYARKSSLVIHAMVHGIEMYMS